MPAEKPWTVWVGDWHRDTGRLSFAARGFWNDVLGFMHLKGLYEINWTSREVANQFGGTPEEVEGLASELLALPKTKEEKSVADGEVVPGSVHLLSRRFLKEFGERKAARDKKIRQRSRPVPVLSPPISAAVPALSRKCPEVSVQLLTAPVPETPLKKQEETTSVIPPDSGTTPPPFKLSSSKTPDEWFTELAGLWNTIPEIFASHVRSCDPHHPANEDRLKRLKVAIHKNSHWPDEAVLAIGRIAGGMCGFMGQNDRGWKPSLDFLWERGKLAKILEGAYDNAQTPKESEA